ncbi:hypothetical protein RSSE_p1591 (plasmid) [Ralstonia solanacearum]|nr:hypothetical protein RSSE_p1591 [Ralstonia solanacearum]
MPILRHASSTEIPVSARCIAKAIGNEMRAARQSGVACFEKCGLRRKMSLPR